MNTCRRDFLRQVGLLSIAVGAGLDLPAVAPRTGWGGLPIPLLTPAQKDNVVRIQNSALRGADAGLPEGVRFIQRREMVHEDRWGLGLKVKRLDHQVKNAVSISANDLESYGEFARQAVDCLCAWFDREGIQMIAEPMAYVGDNPERDLSWSERRRYYTFLREQEQRLAQIPENA